VTEKKAPPLSEEDHNRAQAAIRNAVEKLEERVHKVLEAEVDTLFHDLGHEEKSKIVEKAKRKVQDGAAKVKDQVEVTSRQEDLPFANSQYPYDWPHEDPNHRILHAVESAEKAVLHAVEQEVASLFHGLEEGHEDTDATKHTETILKKGIETTGKQMKAGHENRRERYTLSIKPAPVVDEADIVPEKESYVQRLLEDFLEWDLE
jgi:hypothetical protein